MRRPSTVGRAVVIAALALLGVGAYADSLGSDITIYDNWAQTGNLDWYGGTAAVNNDARTGIREDNETEPGTYYGQIWDLEGMFLTSGNKPIMSIVGGFNFATGQDGWDSGDIFLSIPAGTAELPPNPDGSDYEYVVDLNWSDYSYSIYNISGNSAGLQLVSNAQIEQSNPWAWDNSKPGAGLTAVYTSAAGAFSVSSAISSSSLLSTYGIDFADDTDDPGGSLHQGNTTNHYILSGIDLSYFVPATGSQTFVAHYTMECGNDNLMAAGSFTRFEPPVPEPATLSILSMALLGLGLRARKHLKG